MKHGQKALLCILGGLAFGWQNGSTAGANENPYTAISVRNVFNLRPPPPPTAAEEPAPKTPPAKLFLTGITTIMGNKRALLKGTYSDKPGDPAKEHFLTLSEGERQGEIELISINLEARTVLVDNFGTRTTLAFADDSKGGAAAGGVLPGTGLPAGVPFPPRSLPGLPMRTIRPTPAPGTSSFTPDGAAPATAQTVTSYVPQPRPPQPDDALNRDQQALLMELDREAHKDDPMYPPYPPTHLSEAIEDQKTVDTLENVVSPGPPPL